MCLSNRNVRNDLTSCHSENLDVRILNFCGNNPSDFLSYRAEKLQEYQKKAMRKSGGGASETGSEHSAGSHRAGAMEMNMIQTLPLARPPDRGILKKFPRSADDLLEMASSSLRGVSPRPALMTHLHQLAGERQCLLRPTPMRDASTQGNTLDEGEYESLVSAQSGGESESSTDKKDDLTPSDDDSCCKPTPTPSPPDSGKEEGGKSDDSSGSKKSNHSSGNQGPPASTEKTRRKRIKTIEDLIRQIDAQASSLAKQSSKDKAGQGKREPSLSPSNSEAEADRQYPRGSFYHLSDCEEEKSPQNESPSHQYMPKPMPRLQRQYNPLQVDIPQNVGPFSILSNLPSHSNLSLSSRRFPSNSSTLTDRPTTPSSPREVYKSPPVASLFSKTRSSRSASPSQPPLSPGGQSTSSKLSVSSRPSTNSSGNLSTRPPPLFSGSPLQSSTGRRQSPTNPFTGTPLQMRRSPELNLGAFPLQTMPPLPTNTPPNIHTPPERQTPPEKRSSPDRPPERPPERGSPSQGQRRPPLSVQGHTPEKKDSGVTKPSPLPRTTPVKPRMPSPKADCKNSDHESSPAQSRTASPVLHGSPKNHGSPVRTYSPQPGSDGQHPLTAIPYRGAKNITPGSPPQNQNRSGESSSDPDTPKSSSPKPPPRNPHYINKLTHPLLDGYPFKASHHSLTPDVASNSEGYHSDKAEPDDSIILREIPVVKPDDPQYSNHRRSVYKSGVSDSIDL